MTNARVRFGLFGGILAGLISFTAYGQCSPGTILYSTPTNVYCGPDPNHHQDQQPQQRAEVWRNRYGALAADQHGGPLGVAAGMQSKDAAERAAMEDCKLKGGTHCVLENSYVNGCTALVNNDNGYTFTTKETLQEAVEDAFNMCSERRGANCRLYYKGCSLPVRVR